MSNLHAHVSTASADCDGPTYREYVVTMSEEEVAEHIAADGVNDFSDIHFMNRIMMNHCGPYGVEDMTVKVSEHRVEWSERTDEGHRSGEILWCSDECDEAVSSYRDVYAEQMGY